MSKVHAKILEHVKQYFLDENYTGAYFVCHAVENAGFELNCVYQARQIETKIQSMLGGFTTYVQWLEFNHNRLYHDWYKLSKNEQRAVKAQWIQWMQDNHKIFDGVTPRK